MLFVAIRLGRRKDEVVWSEMQKPKPIRDPK